MQTTQFSLRRLLVLVTVCAVLSLIPVITGHGQLWAAGLLVAGLAAALLLVLNAALYVAVRTLGSLLLRLRKTDTAAP